MKAIYLKPTTEEILISSTAIMITVSGDGQQIVENGGNTGDGDNPITSGDSRRQRSVWDDEELEEEEEKW